ncbi:carbohydrate-binding domain-containing protein [Micromonospora sp. WMMD1102]|uniref:carbohydrate-binding domain-containing protein n=1 Tax=Micromonospora sp. WMMD1102 TaxID=3016105 RepID=UPI002414DEC8|nr:carbohydrate-binding domain-containing protein [Micromonospora sp. WMMD1102]MDG4791137.1 carbohydrate-binding domain-containing protein [Micromonospora sp. WMMD1102]
MKRIPPRAVVAVGLAIALVAGPMKAPAIAAATVPITLTGASATSPSADVVIAGRAVTITAPGTYEVTGTLNDGYLNVDTSASGTVELILNGATITNSSNAPLQVADADQVVITLAAGTTSRLTDATTYVYPDPNTDEPNAALFSSADLRITGTGALNVRGNAYDGITSKDGLVIESGTITVNAVDDGIRGKDFLDITGGTLDVTAGGDGIKSDDTEADRGRLAISNGTVRVSAGDDAIKGENTVAISGGNVTVTNAFEAVESRQITISGGNVNVTARDDALNATEEGYGDFDVAPNAFVRITGGTTLVNSTIDGIDSNGSVTITAGTVVVSGPSTGSPGEGAIDSNGPVYFNGGTVLGAGSTSMAVLSVPPTSGQGWAAPQLSSSQPAGALLHLVSGGQVIVSYRAPKSFREVVFSSNQIQNGQTYDVYLGGSLSGTTVGGMATTGGSIAGASRLMTVTAGQYRGGLVGWPPGGPGWPPPTTPPPTNPPTTPPTPPNPTTPPPGTGGCTASYAVTSQWQGGFQGDVRVTAGSSAIRGWRVTWTFGNGQTISQSWNATISASGSVVTATNVAFNGALGAGASTTFGFIGTWNGSNTAPAVTCTAT